MDCELVCSSHKLSKETGTSQHDCCASKKLKHDKEKKHQNCKGKFGDICFHEVVSSELSQSHDIEFSSQNFLSVAFVDFYRPLLVFQNKSYYPKIPDDRYIRYKLQQKIYILKDQFLI